MSTNPAYIIRETLPQKASKEPGVTVKALAESTGLKNELVYRLLKQMEDASLAACKKVSLDGVSCTVWWRQGDDGLMQSTFGTRVSGADMKHPINPDFGRYPSVWHYGQGVKY